MDPDQTAPKGAVWSGFIVFASEIKLIWNAVDYMQQTLYQQVIFSGQKY